jgi:prepilin-type processing-associated H-X9-DG protein/prepilin-type N-terminal cleavage/methylation domain-containing protein
MQNAERRMQSAEQRGNGESRTLRNRRSFRTPHSALCTLHSALCTRAFTLIEMLVVIGIVGMLAAMVSSVIVYARNLSIRVECQQNLNHIGQTVGMLVLNNNGLFPIGPPLSSNNTIAPLSNAYPKPQASDTNPNIPPNNTGFPWWARVYEQWEDMGLLFVKNANGLYTYATSGPTLDSNFNPNGHVLTAQLPLAMNAFHCRMAGALDGSSVANLFNSISYGINFDVKDAGPLATTPSTQPRPYCASSTSSPYSPDFPNSLNAPDKQPDQYRATEIKNPGAFILISEANTQDPNPANWTGGRIWMGDTSGNGNGYERGPGDSPPYTLPSNLTNNPGGIVGRHSGYANVLFADWHVEAIQVLPGSTNANLNINYNTPDWTLPGN